MEKVIVFGGAGFLGSHIADKLTEAGYKVTIFDLKKSLWLKEDQRMIIGNVLDQDLVGRSMDGHDYVFNMSGIADIDECALKPLDTIYYNIYGNGIVLEACRKANIKRYIFASTIYVYSKSGSFYRCSKQANELYIEQYHESYGMDYTILRYGSLYGPRSDQRNAIYRFVKEALTKGSISYQGDQDAIREYIHVEDAARCSVEILKKEYANQNIILTGHQPMKVKDLLQTIAEIIHRPIEICFEEKLHAAHYISTPYHFTPKIGRKLTPACHVDLGQGLLRIIENLYHELHPELHFEEDLLINNKE